MRIRFLLCLLLGVAVAGPVFAVTYTDTFSAGIDPAYWNVSSNQPLYSVDDTQGDVRFSRPPGGSSGFQSVSIDFRGTIAGDFDASIEFSDAWIDRVNGTPGNQIQLNILFGGQFFAVVRSDESPGGDNRHVFINPPSVWQGAQPSNATSGVLRITRVGTTVSGYLDAALIFSAQFNGDPVTQLWASLQNNSTTDSTTVTFDNFNLTADAVTAVEPVPAFAQAHLLGNIYPNPSDGTFAIDIQSPGLTDATIAVYDVRGEQVDVIRRGPLERGLHTMRWAGGRSEPNGVYFIKLVSSRGVDARRVTILH